MSEVQVALAISIEELNVRLNSGRKLLKSITVDCEPHLLKEHCNNSKFWEESEGNFINKKLDLRLIKSTTHYRLNVYRPRVELTINLIVNNVSVVETVGKPKGNVLTNIFQSIRLFKKTFKEAVQEIKEEIAEEKLNDLREFNEKNAEALANSNNHLNKLKAIENPTVTNLKEIEIIKFLINDLESSKKKRRKRR